MAGKFYTYLNDCPDDFVKSFDVLLKLDDGSKLPAHSQTLARFSGVCAGMLAGGPLSNISASKKATLPLSDCSTATVISLLSVLYAPRVSPWSTSIGSPAWPLPVCAQAGHAGNVSRTC